MRKKTKSLVVGALIALIIIALLFFLNNGTSLLPFDIGGVSTLSLSQVSLQSNNPYLNGQAWLLSFSAGGLGQSYTGTITPSNVESMTPGDLRTTKSFTIDVTYEDEECQYPIQSAGTSTPIYDILKQTYTYIPIARPCTIAGASTHLNIPSSNILVAVNPGGVTCNVIYKTGQSPVGTMGNGNVNAPYTIRLNVDGNVASRRIDPLAGSTSGAIGDYAYAQWNGNLVSGVSCPASYDYRPAYVNGNWRTINKQAYDTYVNRYNQIQSLTTSSSTATINQVVLDVQNSAAQAKASRTFGTISSQSSLSNAVVKVDLASPLQFPVTSLYIKATTLGIFTPVPDIRIRSTNSECFATGNTGVISAVIKNFGDQAGTFTAFATCPSPFQPQQNVQGSLQPNEERTINIPISATATARQTESCTVSVETTAGTRTSSVNACVDPQITCSVPYPQRFCGISGGSEVVQQCSQNGATSVVLETCLSQQYCSDGTCVAQGSSGNTGGSVLDRIKNFFSSLGDILLAIRWLTLIIASLLSFVLTKNIMSKFVSKKDKWIVYAIALLVTGLIALAGYAILLTPLFWTILIIYIVITFILNFTGLKSILGLRKR